MATVKNTKEPKNNISIPITGISSHLFNSENMVVDFSFEGAFVSCKINDFNNYLIDNKQFINKFRKMINDVQKLSQHKIGELIRDFRHCHKTENETKAIIIIKCICEQLGKNENYYDQVFGGEEIYQIGFESEIRLFGKISGNIFGVYFIDYHHDFIFNQKRNTTNYKHCDFCAINSEINVS